MDALEWIATGVALFVMYVLPVMAGTVLVGGLLGALVNEPRAK